MNRKMVLIGAGSVTFTKSILIDLIEDTPRKWNFALVDIDENALDLAYRLCAKMIAEKGADVTLDRSIDRRDVLPGADYVVSTIGVGGRRAWEQDVFIPRKYGVFQPVGDTAMPGGISRAMRMIPDMLDITADVMELCPNAYYFNYSNPMSIICRAIKKKTGARMIGLCHGVWGSEWEIADFVGLPRDECTSYYAGINHLTYIYDFRHKGKDIWPLVREKLAIIKASGYNYADPSRKLPAPEGVAKDMRNPFCWSIFDDHGAFVAPGDYHVIEFYPERFPRGEFYGGVMGMGIPNTFEDLIIGGDAAFEQMREWAFSKEKLPDEAYHTHREKLVEMIDSIEGDKRIIFPVNVPNEGAIASLPKDAVLEIPAAAGSLGFCPLMLTGFSDVLAGIINKQLSIIEVVVEAALNGSRGLFIDSILMGGYITDRVQVEKMVDDLLLEHKKYLPQF